MTTVDDKTNLIIQDILAELARAEHLHPVWPGRGHRGDHVWAAAVTKEEKGELTQAALDWQAHGQGSVAHMKREAIHLGAMAIRFLINLDAVEKRRIYEEELANRRTFGNNGQPPSLDTECDLDDEHNIYTNGGGFAYTPKAERLIVEDYADGAGVE